MAVLRYKDASGVFQPLISGVGTLGDLSDVNTTGAAGGHALMYNNTEWVPADVLTPSEGDARYVKRKGATWVALTPAADWVFEPSFNGFYYNNGMVTLNINAVCNVAPGAGKVITTLPSGYAPPNYMRLPAVVKPFQANGQQGGVFPAVCEVASNGQIQIKTWSGTWDTNNDNIYDSQLVLVASWPVNRAD
jgi:hypothetical protein